MLKIAPKPALCAIFALSSLAACSPDADIADEPATEQRVFSEEDQRIARALSIGNSRAVANADSPYARALLCRHGMDVLADRFREASGLSEQQRQGIEQAQTYFDEELRALAQDEGKTPAELDSDLAQVAEDNPDPGEAARIAIGCLQRLQETG